MVTHLRRRGDEVTVLTSTLGRGGEGDEHTSRLLPLLAQTPRGSLVAPFASISAARATRATIAASRPELIFVWNAAAVPHSAVYAALESGVPTAFRVCEHWFGRLFDGDQFMRHLLPGQRGFRRLWSELSRTVNTAPSLRIGLDRRPFPVAISWNSAFIRSAAPMPTLLEPVFEQVVLSTSLEGERFASVARRESGGKRPLVCYAGRLSSEKGPEVAVRSIAKLRDRHGIEAELILAGPAGKEDRARVEREAEALGVSALCSIPGSLDSQALAELFARSEILVVPSLWAEPFPLVTIEGALARLPVVASRTGGIPEQLEDGREALLFAPGDSDACAEAMAAVLARPAETAARVERAFERASSLSWDAYLGQTDAFIAASLRALNG